jgi:hypothetical protein
VRVRCWLWRGGEGNGGGGGRRPWWGVVARGGGCVVCGGCVEAGGARGGAWVSRAGSVWQAAPCVFVPKHTHRLGRVREAAHSVLTIE